MKIIKLGITFCILKINMNLIIRVILLKLIPIIQQNDYTNFFKN